MVLLPLTILNRFLYTQSHQHFSDGRLVSGNIDFNEMHWMIFALESTTGALGEKVSLPRG